MTNLNEKKEKTELDKYKEEGVDKGLIAMFLKMTPEERLKSNDNAINTIAELRRNAKIFK